MRFAEIVRGVRRFRFLIAAVGTALTVFGCAEGLAPLTSANAPQDVIAKVLRPGAVSLRWLAVKSSANGAIRSYIVERRLNTTGAFVEVARIEQPPLSEILWIDTDVQPETIYGYRVVALTVLGDRSSASSVAGAVTPPLPGISIVTQSLVTSAESLDPDGFQVLIAGPDTVRASLTTSGTKRFSPLKLGKYTVSISGVIDRCSAQKTSMDVIVTDTTAQSLVPVRFDVTCRDPNRGDLKIAVNQTGAVLDQAVSLDVLGQASDTTLPKSEQVFSAQRTVSIGTPAVTFSNVQPGTYTVTVRDIAANCTLSGATSRTATVAKLGTALVTFDLVCRDTAAAAPVSNAPFVWRNRWTPRTATTGTTVELAQTLELTARAGQGVQVVQGFFTYDPAVLRYEEATEGQLPLGFAVNAKEAGVIRYVGGTTGAPRTGVVSLAKFRFTALGATGTTSPTLTTVVVASSGGVVFKDSVRAVEDTFTVGTSGASANQPPVALAGGPYTGVAGTALTLSGAGSSDPDGTIASYAWTFGDNTSGTGVSQSKTYAAAGTYTATLTVTDDKGATATSTATVTVSAAQAGGSAPVARANGPYTATVGTPVTLSSAGSTNATSFSWSVGDGQTVTGASPAVTYAVAGTYTITLTATGAGGVTSTATASVTVSAAPPPPPSTTTLEWKNRFDPFDAANNTVSITILYDTRVNLTETPGAEALEKFAVDSLKWDPSVLQFVSINLGPNITGNSNQVGATAGRLGLSGTIGGAQQQGLITIATIRLRPVGTRNSTTTTKTFLGALLGPSSTNFYSYNSKTTIVEGQFTVP